MRGIPKKMAESCKASNNKLGRGACFKIPLSSYLKPITIASLGFDLENVFLKTDGTNCDN